MRALSLWQPWASLIVAGVKPLETRSWDPPHAFNLPGKRIAIHASLSRQGFLNWPDEPRDKLAEIFDNMVWFEDLPLGKVIGTARLMGCYRVAGWSGRVGDLLAFGDMSPGSAPRPITLRADHWGDYTVGRWCWWLTDIEPVVPPVYARGHQKLWNWTPPEVKAA